MSRNYTIDQSSTTGWWHWACKDGSSDGWSSTKSGAQSAGAAACGGVALNITPPDYNADFEAGDLKSFDVANLDGVLVHWDSTEIDGDAFDFFFGLNCGNSLSTDADKAIAILKIWGVYNGGTTPEEIEADHNLSPEDFSSLVAKNYIGVQLDISDTNQYTWIWP
jgi:hypothetical protein